MQIRKSGLPWKKQRNLIRPLMAGEDWSWRVEGISINALDRFKENDFKRPKGIHRDHVTPFSKTFEQMYETIMSEAEWCKLAYENEACRLVTQEENYGNDFSRIIPIDHNPDLFKNQFIGFRYRRDVEGELLRRLATHQPLTIKE